VHRGCSNHDKFSGLAQHLAMQSGTTAAHAAMGKVQRHMVWFKRDHNGLFVWPQAAPMHMNVWQRLTHPRMDL
jgi:hypothetical protein